MIHISQICNLVIKMTTGQIRYFWTRQKILDQSEAQISTINHLRLIFSPIFQKPEILTRPHFSIQTIFLPHPVLFSIKRQYSHMVQSHNHHHHQQQTLHQLIYELKKIILEVFLIKMYVWDSKTKTFCLWKRCSRILVFSRFFYKSQNFPEFCKFPSQPKFFTLRSSVFLRVGILECSKNNFRTLGQVAHMETTITVTIRPMMISPVLKNPLANSSNLVIIYPIAIYTLQIMVMVQHHHQRTHQVVDHVVTLILHTIPIPIIMVALNRE